MRCLDSLYDQNFPKDEYEVIVVDGGNSKDTVEAMNGRGLRFIYVKQIDRGIPKATNMGIEESSGSIIAFIDDDCVATKNWVRNGLTAFSQTPKWV